VIVVFDTNIWISALFFGGKPEQAILKAYEEDEIARWYLLGGAGLLKWQPQWKHFFAAQLGRRHNVRSSADGRRLCNG